MGIKIAFYSMKKIGENRLEMVPIKPSHNRQFCDNAIASVFLPWSVYILCIAPPRGVAMDLRRGWSVVSCGGMVPR